MKQWYLASTKAILPVALNFGIFLMYQDHGNHVADLFSEVKYQFHVYILLKFENSLTILSEC